MSDAFGGEEPEPLILTKKIKVGAGHHGGAWKVAYADFVTAMMAFFLLLWLLNATTEEQMNGISDYFAPTSVATSEQQGLGQALAGLTVAADEALRSPSSRPSVSVAIPTFGEEESGEETGTERVSPDLTDVNTSQASEVEEEDQRLDEAQARLRQSILENPETAELQDSLQMEQTEEGLRIQILDLEKHGMFEPGTSELTRRAIRLLALIGSIASSLPNDITITGHTDAAPPAAPDPAFGNWELSGERAARSRQWLVEAGLDSDQIVLVAGKGDSEPLIREDPGDPRNRRLSIVIVRENKLPDTAGGAPSAGTNAAPNGATPPALPE